MRILIIDGHPDGRDDHFIHALARAYATAAEAAGHEVRTIAIGTLEVPLLRDPEDFQHGEPSPLVHEWQDALSWAQHVVVLYPLWLGSMPAALKAFLEQVMRPKFAFGAGDGSRWPKRLLKGRSARVVVTMGMPALIYRWFYRSHGVKSLERNVLAFCGLGPIRTSLIGSVESIGSTGRGKWLNEMETLGRLAR